MKPPFALLGRDWDLERKRVVPVSNSAIECFCAVNRKLWIGTGHFCVIMGMGSLRLQVRVQDKQTERNNGLAGRRRQIDRDK